MAGSGGPKGVDQIRGQIEQLAGQVRDIGDMVDAVAADFPNAAQEVAQVKTLLKQIVIKVANEASTATASGSGVPTGGSMNPNAA